MIRQAIRRVAENDRPPVGLAAIDDKIRSAMAPQHLLEEALCRSDVPLLAEEELDRIEAPEIDSGDGTRSNGMFSL